MYITRNCVPGVGKTGFTERDLRDFFFLGPVDEWYLKIPLLFIWLSVSTSDDLTHFVVRSVEHGVYGTGVTEFFLLGGRRVVLENPFCSKKCGTTTLYL